MNAAAQRLEGFIDLIVEAVLRDLNSTRENADDPGQEKRRRGERADETPSPRAASAES